MIEITDFHKAFDDESAVAGLTFEVATGQTLGLIGPNGAGKTTTLRALAGIIPASRGRLAVAGADVEKNPLAAKSKLAFVPDDPPLFHDLTVAEHLAFYSRVYKVADADTKAQALLEEFELAHKYRAPASDLSRGMRQKLAICCAFLHDPQVILLDEPLTGLDPRGIRKFKDSLAERSARGASVIISSHLLAMVEDVCSHVLILDNGHSCFFGPIDGLRSSYNLPDGQASLEEIFFEATSAAEMASAT